MRHENSVFQQLTKHIPWSVFDAAVEQYRSDYRVRRLRTRDQFLALLFGQISGAASLREIEDGLSSHQSHLYHLGARTVARSTLADANATRPYEVYRDVFAAMARQARGGVRRKLRHAVRLIDATRIDLSGLSRGWVPAVQNHYAGKVHVVFDPQDQLPLEAVVTPCNVNDITPAKAFALDPGATYVFDLGYYSYEWWARLDEADCRFVTRLKKNTTLRDVSERPVPQGQVILADRVGSLPKHTKKGKNPFAKPVREIVIRTDQAKTLRLLTNDLQAPAQEIADLYKQRWDIELFFKWIKQNLKIKHFLGVSENAVKTQIYIALIAFLILRAAHAAQQAVQRPQAFARLARLNIMQRRPISRLKDPPIHPTKDRRQLCLELPSC